MAKGGKTINWRYAIGELLIVTIGISLAFSLNSWNEYRKENERARVYLINLREDLTRDVDTLNAHIKSVRNRLDYANRYIIIIVHLERITIHKMTKSRQWL